MTMTADILIIGDRADPHVEDVIRRLDPDRVAVTDAASLADTDYLLTADHLELTDQQTIFSSGAARGWVRRLAPPDWGHGHHTGSRQAAAQAATISLIAGMTRLGGIAWLTHIDPLLIAESKLVQIQAAITLGIRTPRTLVTGSNTHAQRHLGPKVVIKPLGPGHFTTDDGAGAVAFATAVDLRDPEFADLGPTPFIIQEKIPAQTHLRVVTVNDRCWVAELNADGRPMDWRAQDAAHQSFQTSQADRKSVTAAATALALNLDLGYSSQDWIVTPDDSEVLLDVNPAGQWLFLPDSLGSDVSSAIASWLSEG